MIRSWPKLPKLRILRSMIEPSLDMMAGALFELIALARVHEYTEVLDGVGVLMSQFSLVM